MSHIVLNHEQVKILFESQEPVEVRDPSGTILGKIDRNSEQLIVQEAKRRLASNQPRFSSQEVQTHLQALEEATRNENLNPDQLRLLMEQFQRQSSS